jgi:hypothetical protein
MIKTEHILGPESRAALQALVALDARDRLEVLNSLKSVLKDFEIKIGLPSDEVIKDIVRDQKPKKLNSHQVAALKRTIISILTSKRESQNLEKKLGPYSEFSKSLKRIEKYLGLLRFEVSKNTDQIDYFFGSDMRKSLGLLVAWSSVSQSEGAIGQLYLEMIDALYLPIKKRVDLKNKGGRPSIWTRDLVLEMLASDSEAIIGTPATATAGSGFVRLCDSVLRALQVSTEGLEQAIERKLGKTNRRKVKASPRGARK